MDPEREASRQDFGSGADEVTDRPGATGSGSRRDLADDRRDVTGARGDLGDDRGDLRDRGDMADARGDMAGAGGDLGDRGDLGDDRGGLRDRGDMTGDRGDLGDGGDMTGARGDMAGTRGDVAGARGDVAGARGDVAGTRGDMAGARGDRGDGTGGGASMIQPDTAPGPGLLSSSDESRYRDTWRAVQGRFVDDPHEAVRAADALVAEVIQSLAERFSEHKGRLESQWQRGGEPDTEELRQALQRYRDFFDRLLSA